MNEFVLIKKTLGLNTVIKNGSHVYSKKYGVSFMSESVNIDVDRNLNFTTRPLFEVRDGIENLTAIIPCCDGFLALSKFGEIFFYEPKEKTTMRVAENFTGGFCFSGTTINKRTFFSNGVNNGTYKDGVVSNWEKASENRTNSYKILTAPPVGNFLCKFIGRIFIASGSTLWFTEALNYYFVDRARNFMSFGGNITGLVVAENGLYVGVEGEGIYFLKGKSADKLEKIFVYDETFIPGTACQFPGDGLEFQGAGEFKGKQTFKGEVVSVASTRNSIVVLGDDGSCLDISSNSLDLPDSTYGSAYIKKGKYVVSLF